MTIDELDILLRILLSVALGGVIGIERELRDQAAGFRTHILVSVGAAAFTIASAYGFDGFVSPGGENNVTVDPSRISAQIVSGIGFLGAGAIIRHGLSVRGLTTAASLWAAAAVGLASGLGSYALAAITAAAVVASLYSLRLIERHIIYPRVKNLVAVDVTFRERGFGPLARLIERLDEEQVIVSRMTDHDERTTNTIHLVLQLPRSMTPAQILERIRDLEDVKSAHLD